MRFSSNRVLRHVALTSTLFLGACGARGGRDVPAPRERALAAIIDSIIDEPPLHRTTWGIAARDVDSGEMLYEHNADRHMIPASNTKLVVTLVAMGELGPDWRYHTEVQAIGGTDTLPDVLVVRGSGDPTISERFDSTDFAGLDSLAARIAASGVRGTTGDLIVDATRFIDERANGTWEIGDLPFSYATPTGAFAVNEGTFCIVRTPATKPGDSASVEVLGGLGLQPLVASVITDTAGARTRWTIDYIERHDTIHIAGSLPAGAPPDTQRLAVVDAESYAGRAFLAALERAGVKVGGELRIVRDTAKLLALGLSHPGRTVATRESPPVREIIAAILKPSQNWIAEQLLKTLGAERGEGGSWEEGIAVEERFLTRTVGIDSLAFNLRDGSGLSAQNLLTPAVIVALLDYARISGWSASYRDALPAPGERGGTLSNRLPGFETRLAAKTGTIANVNTLSGYLETDDGRDVIFSIMTNGTGLPSGRLRGAIDGIIGSLAASRN
jgi:D-alanyl-D-alanine carboxypeptidase/D-alanyl-D-alanine-endopeptidase (penicillin-binding protein 4)